MAIQHQTMRESNIRETIANLKKIYSNFSFVTFIGGPGKKHLRRKPIKSFASFILDYILKHESVHVVGRGKIGGLEISTDENGVFWDFGNFSDILAGYHAKTEKSSRNCKYLKSYGCTQSKRVHERIEYWTPYSTQDFTVHTTYDSCSMDPSGRDCEEYKNKFGNLKPLKEILKDFRD